MVIKEKEYTEKDLLEIFLNAKTLNDVSKILFNKVNYTNREKIKKIAILINFDWNKHIETIKRNKVKYCECCGKELIKDQQKFCSHSCSAKVSNLGKTHNPRTFEHYSHCKCCGKKFLKETRNKFCNNICQKNYQYKIYIDNWKKGLENGIAGKYSISAHIKKYLFEKYDSKCSECGWDKKNKYTGKIPLEIDHIDGNYLNNDELNLRLLCPNCHSLTPTYKGANMGNGRKDRKIYL